MSVTDFNALFALVAAKTPGWVSELILAWPCLTEDQKLLIEAIA